MMMIDDGWFSSADLAGKTDLDQARCDMIIDCFDDIVKPAATFFYETDAAKKVG